MSLCLFNLCAEYIKFKCLLTALGVLSPLPPSGHWRLTTRLREPQDSWAQRTRRTEKWILLAQPQSEAAQQSTYLPSLRPGPACPFPRSRPLHVKPPDSLTLSTFSGGGDAPRPERALGQPIPSVAPTPPHSSRLPRIKFRFQSLVK